MEAHTFPSFDAYLNAIHQADVRMILTGPPRADWILRRQQLGDVDIQWGQNGAANITQGTIRPGGLMVCFFLDHADAMVCNGRRLDDRTILVLLPGDEFCIVAQDVRQWRSVFVPFERLGDVALESCKANRRITCLADENRHCLRRIVERIVVTSECMHNPFAQKAEADAAAHEVVDAVRRILTDQPQHEPPRHGRHLVARKQIISAVMETIEHHAPSEPRPSIPRLAHSGDISERTLRTAFREYFGLSPHRYLKLQRLHHARKAIRLADPDMTNVTTIAAGLGIWEFGRFAHDYRTVFGEHPSQTLRSASRRMTVSAAIRPCIAHPNHVYSSAPDNEIASPAAKT